MLNTPWSAKLVARCAKHRKPAVRVSAARAAGCLDQELAEPILRHLLKSRVAGVRKWVIRSVRSCLGSPGKAGFSNLLTELQVVKKCDCMVSLRREAAQVLRVVDQAAKEASS